MISGALTGRTLGHYAVLEPLGVGGPAFVRRTVPSPADLRRGRAAAKETIR